MVDGAAVATQGSGATRLTKPPEAKDMDSRNLPSAYIELLKGKKAWAPGSSRPGWKCSIIPRKSSMWMAKNIGGIPIRAVLQTVFRHAA